MHPGLNIYICTTIFVYSRTSSWNVPCSCCIANYMKVLYINKPNKKHLRSVSFTNILENRLLVHKKYHEPLTIWHFHNLNVDVLHDTDTGSLLDVSMSDTASLNTLYQHRHICISTILTNQMVCDVTFSWNAVRKRYLMSKTNTTLNNAKKL